MQPQPIGVSILLFDKTRKKILLGKRKNSYRSGWYGMPGGRLDLEESLIDCCKRELQEETGIQATSLAYLGVIRELQEGYNFIHFAFTCTDYKGEPKVMEPEKCEAWEWHALNELPTNILKGQKGALDILNNPGGLNIKDIYSR